MGNQREDYTDMFKCNKKCTYVMGATPRSKCIQNCMKSALGMTAMQKMTQKCTSDDDCGPGQLCIKPGPYTGGSHGYCMSDNEPGIPRMTIKRGYDSVMYINRENFALPRTCTPEHYFNEVRGRCEPRFQGVSSASAVWTSYPAPAPDVSLPGTTMSGYGVGYMDPVNVPVPIRLGKRGPALQLITDR